MLNKKLASYIVCIVLSAAVNAQADTITLGSWGFSGITNNSPMSVAVGEAQLTVDLVAREGNLSQVQFLFRNLGPNASSITDVYFDDGTDRTLYKIVGIIEPDYVNFSVGARPGNLPGGESLTPAFTATPGLSVDSDSPATRNGVNPGEWLGLVISLTSGNTWQDVLDDLASQDLRIGVHVQGFDNGGSESFLNSPRVDNPTPSALVALIGLGAMGAVQLRRRSGRKSVTR